MRRLCGICGRVGVMALAPRRSEGSAEGDMGTENERRGGRRAQRRGRPGRGPRGQAQTESPPARAVRPSSAREASLMQMPAVVCVCLSLAVVVASGGRARGAGGLLSSGRAFSEIDNGWSLQRVQAVRTSGRRDGGETGRAGAATGRSRIIGSASCLPVGRSGRSFAVPDCLTATGGPGETWSDSLCEGLDRARGGSRPVPFPGLNTMRGPRPVRDRPV